MTHRDALAGTILLLGLALPGLTPGCCPPPPQAPPRPLECFESPRAPDLRADPVRPRPGPAVDVQLTRLAGLARPPASVQVLLRARRGGLPVPFPPAGTLTLHEDGQPVPPDQAAVIRQPAGAPAVVLLLVDLSGELSSPARVPLVQARLRTLVAGLGSGVQVGLAGFDGRAGVQVLHAISADRAALETAITGLASFTPADRSRNLYGAVDQAITLLEAVTPVAPQPFLLRTLVLVTTGPDVAARVSHDAVYRRLETAAASGLISVSVGLGPQVDRIVLEELGQAEHAHAARLDLWTVEAMHRLAARIRGHWASHGVVSLCSPRRAGTHVLAVAPRGQPGPGARFVFDATGFTGGCAAAWDRSDCRFVTCGGPEGSACASCPAGQVCRDHACVDARIEQEAAARAAAQRRRAEAHQAREEAERLRLLGTCRREQHRIGQRYDAWVARQARGEKPDCGFRLQAELGARAYPVPRGMAGAVLVGYAWARRVEVQAGVGFSAAHGVLLAQLPIRLYTRRWLDLLVVPRAGVGFGQGMVLAEAEAFLGVRLRVHRHLALYGLMGPGVAYTHKQDISRTSFTLPFWLGMEVRR